MGWMKLKTKDSRLCRINPQKPEKVSRVCNAAAKYKGESLNDKPLIEPELLQNLFGIFFRFREHQIALPADIGAMFLPVKVPGQECRVLRFLWRSKQEEKIGVCECTRNVFGAKSSPTFANYDLPQAEWTIKKSPNSCRSYQKKFLHG